VGQSRSASGSFPATNSLKERLLRASNEYKIRNSDARKSRKKGIRSGTQALQYDMQEIEDRLRPIIEQVKLGNDLLHDMFLRRQALAQKK
jgi:hypothetical protein